TNGDARSIAMSTLLASQKMEQLRSLAWAVDATGAAVSDTSTDLTVSPERPSGGVGLSSSPNDSLSRNRVGYCDFVDDSGHSLGGGRSGPPGTVFIRRWSIERLSSPDESLLMQVSVIPVASKDVGGSSRERRLHDEARLLTIKSRKGG